MIHDIKIELDGVDITSKVKSLSRSVELEHKIIYDIVFLDGREVTISELGRVKVIKDLK